MHQYSARRLPFEQHRLRSNGNEKDHQEYFIDGIVKEIVR